jgi:hypothetical protein
MVPYGLLLRKSEYEILCPFLLLSLNITIVSLAEHVARRRERTSANKIFQVNLKGKAQLRYVGIDVRIILRLDITDSD